MLLKRKFSLFLLLVIYLCFIFSSSFVFSQEKKIAISKIKIKGAYIISSDFVKDYIKARPPLVSPATITQDIKRLYKLGFYKKVKA
ncbi:MAG: hypothetical protein D6780_02380, partial [Candidatus Dadabacteria bacterium]